MIPVLSTSETQRLDREASDPVSVLMERAGWAVAGAAIEFGIGYGTDVSVLAGPGNNGGDGWVAARRLAGRGAAVTVHELAQPTTDAAIDARRRALASGVRVADLTLPRRDPSLIVDALFGSGLSRALPDEVEPWLEQRCPVVAAHVPSGLDPESGRLVDRAFRADTTVVFHSLSPGHLLGEGPDRCGEIVVVDIGLTGGNRCLEVVEDSDVRLPPRSRTGHKWSVGSVLVVGGSEGMIGAAVMAAKAALRFGAGSVGLAVPDDLVSAASLLAPELLIYPQSALPDRFDVIVAGPGMGSSRGPLPSVLEHLGPVVLDADGIGAVTESDLDRRGGHTVLTPHAGEFQRLTGDPAGHESATGLAERTGVVVLLKGNPTFVCDGGVPACVVSNGPELATIGTGDVLAGMTGALLARGLDPAEAAWSAAHVHGVAGEDLARSTTVTALGLIDRIGRYSGVTR